MQWFIFFTKWKQVAFGQTFIRGHIQNLQPDRKKMKRFEMEKSITINGKTNVLKKVLLL